MEYKFCSQQQRGAQSGHRASWGCGGKTPVKVLRCSLFGTGKVEPGMVFEGSVLCIHGARTCRTGDPRNSHQIPCELLDEIACCCSHDEKHEVFVRHDTINRRHSCKRSNGGRVCQSVYMECNAQKPPHNKDRIRELQPSVFTVLTCAYQ